MAQSLTLTRIDYPAGGGVRFMYSNGSSRDFVDAAEARQFADDLDTTLVLEKAAVGKALDLSPDLSDDSEIEGKTFTYDPRQNLAILGVS
jgi:hypothetical protein